jgi:predicted metal-dependent phosphoesterase TrpH
LIDLHLHTTASDGCDTPAQLIERVRRAGIRVFAVTDHDTVAALAEVATLASQLGIGWVPGIEVTAVEDGRDVHVLGYGFEPEQGGFETFLVAQRASRLERVRQFARRFAELAMPFDAEPLVARADTAGGRAVGRAHVARALVAAGHVESVDEAFASWLSPGRPGFVPRLGASVNEVVRQIHAAGGIASLAHPALLHDDDLVRRLLSSGLDAIEVYHSEHDDEATARYRRLSGEAGLLQTGGSDFHGDAPNRRRVLGGTPLPEAAYRRLRQHASRVGCPGFWPAIEGPALA